MDFVLPPSFPNLWGLCQKQRQKKKTQVFSTDESQGEKCIETWQLQE
jgi:hypothetical protein